MSQQEQTKVKKKYKVKGTARQRAAIDILVENRGKSVSGAMREAGYPEKTAKNPKNLTESKAWEEIIGDALSFEELAEEHKQLLNSTKIEHMVFPLGPRGEDDDNLSGARPDKKPEDPNEEKRLKAERTTLTDKEIIGMLAEVNCKVRRIVHGETARHVYYWAADNKARKDALDMAYKIRGTYAPEKSINLNVEVEASPEIKKITEELNALHRGTSVRSDGGSTGTVDQEVSDKE